MTSTSAVPAEQPPAPDPSDAGGRDERDDRRAPERTCVATRTVRPADELIRFVRAPDGTVVPDLKRALPGRGVWVTASQEAVRLAVKKKAFARGFKEAATVDPAIDETVGTLMARSALGMLGFANKAGLVVTGFAKVEAALAKEQVIALVEASDASEDGVRKLRQAATRLGRSAELRVVRLFDGPELDLALGRSNVVHAALLAGPVSAAFLARCDAYARYLGMKEGSGPAENARPSSTGSGGTPERTDRA
ncbi:RNA-binding protein [Hansschlegelia zhihuaiae]|uniref:RNA-binding protein n=1 Tax=Hansschlegelia zhihuaiae TaxID=405005 RepID=A0A4Q0MHP2_9HYPH|nr:RNA-binding protein [Hansschlegelia zhihuaiae]RXF73111.1 RNA-binding protein [Hansschlegelia zhihuaiae]